MVTVTGDEIDVRSISGCRGIGSISGNWCCLVPDEEVLRSRCELLMAGRSSLQRFGIVSGFFEFGMFDEGDCGAQE